MRMGAGEFGPVALAAVRVTGAALLLVPLLAWRGQLAAMRRHWRPILVVGLTNTALPFLCFSYAALSITAGMSSIFNAASPLFGALIARLWLRRPADAGARRRPRDRLRRRARDGVGPAAASRPAARAGPILACLVATLSYGFSPNYTKRRLQGVAPLAIAAGSQVAATLMLIVPAILWWPAQQPAATDWLSAAVLAFACTGFAYILYFRLIANVGPSNAIAVTFLIPAFAVVWGWMFLGERVTLRDGRRLRGDPARHRARDRPAEADWRAPATSGRPFDPDRTLGIRAVRFVTIVTI